MLEKIICDKFVGADIANGTVAFHDGLNIVMGGEDADNSIGKSTMMLIIDYCFGGTSYPNEDIVEKVKGHEIRWIMNFGDASNPDRHYFGRNAKNGKDAVVYYSEGFQGTLETKDYLSYKKDLHHWLGLDEEIPLSLMTSLFFRIYGKQNIHLREPIKSYPSQPKRESITLLEKLFLKYHLFAQAKDSRADLRERIDLQDKQIAKEKTFCASSEADVQANLVRIRQINALLKKMRREEDERINEERLIRDEKGAKIKRQLTKLNRRKSRLLAETEAVQGNLEGILDPEQADLNELGEFFPLMNLKEIHDVQEFHAKTVSILKKVCSDKIDEYQKEIRAIDREIKKLEAQLISLGISINYSQSFLDKQASLERELFGLLQQNAGYQDRLLWEDKILEDDATIKETEPKALKEIQDSINELLVSYSTSISGSNRLPPRIMLADDGEHYGFVSPFDKGTGTDYRNIIMFDLAIIHLTQLPCLIHDSLLFKNIDVVAQEAILNSYLAIKGKQVFIAYDNLRNLNDSDLKKKILSLTVMRLGRGRQALFGEDWGILTSEAEALAQADLASEE